MKINIKKMDISSEKKYLTKRWWILNLKKIYSIVSREITKFITCICYIYYISAIQ